MKIFFGRFLVACFLLVAASFVFAGEFKSRIITSSPLTITVQDDQFLRISNFTQQGGVDRGVVTVTLNDQTANVLTASRVDTVSSGGGSPTAGNHQSSSNSRSSSGNSCARTRCNAFHNL